MDSELKRFIAHARAKGMDYPTIRMLLLSSGWKEKDIAGAMTEQSLDMAVPQPSDSGGAREAFFHLLTFSSLYITVVSIIILYFTFINRLFPDSTVQSPGYEDTSALSTIRWSLASIIIAYPLLILLSRFLLKEMQRHPERAWSGIRRWLTYLTLFLTALVLIGDGVTLLYYLLDGELSIRFILKVGVILVVAGMTFAYYFLSLRTSPSSKK